MNNVSILHNNTVISRRCPGCGYVVSQIVVENAKHNYLCPGCERHKIKNFNIYDQKLIKHMVRAK